MRIDVITPGELGEAGRAEWRRIQALDPALSDPFHAPEWAEIIGQVRRDARVAVIEDAGQTIGFLAVQKSPPFSMMGLGAPICDGDGLIARPDASLDLALLPRALKTDRVDFGKLPLACSRYDAIARVREEVMVADLTGWAAFLEARKAEGSSTLRNLEKKKRKLAREHGELEFRAFTPDTEALAAMFDWKQEQFERTRQPNVLARAWCREAHERVAAASCPHFSGEMFSLRCGDRPVAALLAMQAGPVLHAWMIAHDPDPALAPFSPGAMVWHHMFEAAHARGVELIDFGCGDYPYKRYYKTGVRQIGVGFIGQPGVGTVMRGGMFAARSMLERSSNQLVAGLPGRIMRRLDIERGLAEPLAA